MPPRSQKPGFKLKRGRNNRPYWIARQVVRDTMGYPESCVPLPLDGDEELWGRLCRDYTARLLGWIEGVKSGEDPRIERYDGTMLSACRVYQTHPFSRFHKVKANTRKSYVDSLTVIESTVGKRLIRKLNPLVFQYWYDEWRKPAVIAGPERIKRAYDAITMVKTVLRFNAALGRQDCKRVLEELEKATSLVNFERGAAREEQMTRDHVYAFLRTARDLGARGVIPADRALHMALGVAAQFELLLRQRDIIGEHAKTQDDLDKAMRRGATSITWLNGDVWVGYFTWENIPGWRWRTKTSKSKYRTAVDFDLQRYELLMPLLEQVPFERRHGAVVKGEGGGPIRERSYRKWYRQIAQAAGIPDDVWNMDSRAGGATEAWEAGMGLNDLTPALTHSKKETTLRYIRSNERRIANVAEARKRARKAAIPGPGTLSEPGVRTASEPQLEKDAKSNG